MSLQTMKSREGAKRAWARTAALLLFLVTGVLLVASLSTARSTDLNRHGAPGVHMTNALNGTD